MQGKSLINKNIVLKGVRGNFSDDDVKAELNELNIANVNIVKVSKVYFNKNNKDFYHFLIQLFSDSNVQNLTKIKTIAFQKIRWEPLRKRDIFQCKNCQRLGHSSANCAMGYRCVKCNKNHKPGECAIPKDTTDKNSLYCVNCEVVGHTASYRGCPLFKFAKDLNEAKNVQNRKTHNDRLNRINSNFSRSASNNAPKQNYFKQTQPIVPHLTEATLRVIADGNVRL